MPFSLEEAYQKVVSEMGPIAPEPGGYMSLDEAYEHVMSQPEFALLREEESSQRRTESRYTRPSSYDDNKFTLDDVGTYASDLWNAGISGAQGGMANLSDAVGYVANKIGMDSLRDTAHSWARSWEADAQNRMRNVVDPEGFGNRVASGMGSSLTMMIPGAAVAAAGAASGGALPGLLGLAAGGTIGLSEAAGTAGGVYRSLKDQGLSEDEANRASNRLFLTEAPLDILSESALGFLPGARAMKGVIKNPVLRSVAGEAAQEALQETYQGLLEPAAQNSARGGLSDYLGALWNEGKNIPEVFMREGLPAAVSGAIMGGAGTVLTNRGFSTPTVEVPKPETAGTVPGNVAPQMPQKMSDVFKPAEPQPVMPETAKPLPGAMPAAETPAPTGRKAETIAAANMQKVAEMQAAAPAAEQTAQEEVILEDTGETLDDLRAQMAEEYQNLRQMDAEEREDLPPSALYTEIDQTATRIPENLPSTLSELIQQSGRRYEQSPNVQNVIGHAPERDMMIAGEKGAKDVIKKKDQDVVNVGGRNIRVREMPLSVPDFRAIPSDRAVEIAKSKLRDLIKRGDIRSEAGLTAHFKERPGTDFDYYFNHLTRGDKKKNGTQEAEILRTQQGSLIDLDGVWGPMQRERLAALWLAEDTIKHPNLGIYQPDRNTRMLASIYHAPDRIKGQGNFGDYVIVAVDPNGGNVVVTSFSTQDSRSKKNRTLRYLNQQLEKNEGSVEYVEDLSRADGALPPTVGAMRSSESAFLPQSDTQTIPQNSNSDNREVFDRLLATPERGDFGPIWRGYEGEAAVEKLLEERQGEVVGAMSDPRLGENSSIDFVWGTEKYGLAHIEKKHGADALMQIPQIIRRGTPRPLINHRISYETDEGLVILKNEWKGAEKNWILTSYLPQGTKKDSRSAQDTQTGGRTEESASSSDGNLFSPRISQNPNNSNRDFSVRSDLPQTKAITAKVEGPHQLSRIRDIIEALRKIAPVRRGVSASAGVMGYTSKESQSVHIRYAGDYKTALHEIGHIVDYRLQLREAAAGNVNAEPIALELAKLGEASSPESVVSAYHNAERGSKAWRGADEYLRKEGIAQFFREYALDPDLAEVFAPEYASLFKETLESAPELKALAEEAFDAVRNYEALTPGEKLLSNTFLGDEIRKSKTLWEKVKGWVRNAQTEFDDKYAPLKRLQDVMRDRAVVRGRTELIQHGEMKDSAAFYNMFRTMPGWEGKAKSDLQNLLAPVRNMGREAYNRLGAYATALRCLDYWDNGMEPGIGVTREDTAAIARRMEHEHPEIAEAYGKIREAYDAMTRRTMVDSGVWSESQLAAYRKKWPHYVPFMRIEEDGTIRKPGSARGNRVVNLSKLVEASQGVDSPNEVKEIEDPFQAMVENVLSYHRLAEKNRCGQSLVAAAKADPALFADLIEPVKGGEKDGVRTFWVWFDGKKQFFTGDKALLDAVTEVTRVSESQALKALGKVSSAAVETLKLGATRANPFFIVRNLFRDAFNVSITSSGLAVPFYNTARGLLLQMSRSPEKEALVKDALEHGLAYSGITEVNVSSSPEKVAKVIRDVIKDDAFMRKFNGAMKKAFGWIGELNEMVEVAPKLAEYERLVKEGYPKRYAATMAREVNLDFNRGGEVGKRINRHVPFFNPAIQGTSKLIRTFKEFPMRTLGRTAMFVILPSVVSWAAGSGDDEYKKISRNIKDRYWLFKSGGTWIRVPKPEVIGLAGSFVERMLDAAMKHDPMAFRDFKNSVIEGALPPYMPILLGPSIEVATNRSFFTGRALIPPALEHLPPELQYLKSSSATAKFLGKTFGVSPIIVDHLVSSYGARVGDFAMRIPDLIAEDTEEAKKFSESTWVSDFTVDPNRNSESLAKFYDLRRQATVAKNAYDVRRKMGEQPEYSAGVHMAKAFDQSARKLSDWRKDIAAIQQSKSMTPERKREVIDRIRLRMNQEAEAAIGNYFTVKGKLDRRKR